MEKVWCAWVDLDSSKAAQSLADFELKPSVVVSTGTPGHLQAYWPLSEPAKPAVIERVNRALAERLGGDSAVCDSSRTMRLPGSFNCKHDPPVKARVVEANEQRFHLEDLEAALELNGNEGADRSGTAAANMSTKKASKWTMQVLDRLEGVQKSGDGWQALCPAHDDHRPSLAVAQGKDGVCLLYCHAGCDTADVIAAIGLDFADLDSKPKRGDGVAAQLVREAHDSGLELFHDAHGDPYVRVQIGDHFENWPLKSATFRRWLRRLLYIRSGKVPGQQSVVDATEILQAEAEFDGPQREVEVCVGVFEETIFIDLGDEAWRVAEVSPDLAPR